jgi:hypothetical protein
MANISSRPQWTDKYKQNWDEAYERVMAWWHNEETDRPLVFNHVPKPASERTITSFSPKDAEEAERLDFDINTQLHNTKAFLENNLFLAESVPRAMSNFASLLGMLCVQAGGTIHYAPDTLTAWLEQEEDLYERPLPDVTRPCPPLAFVLETIRRNHEAFGYDVVLGANPMLDPLTTLSMMRGTDNFCLDLLDRPDEVKRWTKRLGEFYRQAVEGYRTARTAVGRREDYNWSGAWAPGDMDAIQCDVSSMLSPEMFREFALPEAEKEAAFFDYTIWHLDGTAEFNHIDDICGIKNLHAIQYIDEKGRDPLEFIPIWERILRYGKSIVFTCRAEHAAALTKRLGHRGIAFYFLGIDAETDLEGILKGLSQI